MLIHIGRFAINPEHIEYIEELQKTKNSYLIIFSSGDTIGLNNKEYTELIRLWNPEQFTIGEK